MRCILILTRPCHRTSLATRTFPVSSKTGSRALLSYAGSPPSTVTTKYTIRMGSTTSSSTAPGGPSTGGMEGKTTPIPTPASLTTETTPETKKKEEKKRTPINLHRGWPNTSLLPVDALKKAAQAALSDASILTPASALLYAPDPGFQELREALAVWLDEFYSDPIHRDDGGVPPPNHHHQKSMPPTSPPPLAAEAAAADTITITGGASQSLANVLASFTDPAYTRAVWMVAPAYFLACPIMADAGFGAKMRAVPEDDEGIDLEFLRAGLEELDSEKGGSEKSKDNKKEEGSHQATADREGEEAAPRRPVYKNPAPYRKIYRHVIYCVPTFANPSGKTMSLARRRALVELAREHDALVVSDDVYDMLQWSTTSSPPGHSAKGATAVEALAEEVDLNRALLPRLVDIDLALGPSRHDEELSKLAGATTTKTIVNALGIPLEPAQKRQHFGHAISNGSFSKLAGPGLRTGWTQSTPDFALGLSQTGATRSGGAPSQMTAAIVCQLLRSGDLQREIESVLRPTYRRRHRLLMTAVERALVRPFGVMVGQGGLLDLEDGAGGGGDGGAGGGTVQKEGKGIFGGYFIWLTLPVGTEEKPFPGAKAIAARCMRDEDLVIGHGGMFEVQGDEAAVRLDHAMRLCFAWEEEQNLVEGVERLGQVIGRMLDDGPSSWQGAERDSSGTAEEQK
ncbi:pyridoxal phosphate-dependent transferase [Microdochium trichocladiopsis]|uniref:Pyridoxal phosphate-dependent transferase n=1 Tax=Microdochium trichocladiopsis TaxID=1682393 RepID=A0A9P9BTH7_9PEZI|nr:pyridoxal phosphate-dependent transferase [Microdochium trichocladiopsis]KAH7035507.1 pyridoxal phosphate-dependent transferase [Microdochium trichocladiopsis]